VEDGLERLKAVRLVRLGNSEVELWRLPTSYPRAQSEILEALPKLKPPMLSLRACTETHLARFLARRRNMSVVMARYNIASACPVLVS